MTERFKLVNKSRINNNRVRLIKTGTSTSQLDPLFGAIYENESEVGLCLSPNTIISCVGAKVESEEIVLDGASWAVEIDGVVVELPLTSAFTPSSTVTYEAMVALLEEHGIRVTELKGAVTQPIYCDGAVSTESCKMQDGGWMLEVDGVDMGGPYDLASLDEYSRRREVRIFVTPPLIKFENVSSTEHHTVRLTPVNGETVDPTTLVGAALWLDDLSMCLAPPPKDESCYGKTEAAYITTMPMTLDQIEVVINDVEYGLLVDENSGKITYEVLPDNTLVITNTTNECIRVVLGTSIENGIINSESLIFAVDKPEPYFAFPDENEQFNGVVIHLTPSRLGQVAIDSFYRVDGTIATNAIFGGRTVDFVIKTNSLLPTAGLTFNLDGQDYHMAYGQTELVIPYEIAINTTRYPKTLTPVLTINEPEYLLGGELPSISSITVKPQGFNYGIDVTIQGQYVNSTRQTSTTEPNVSFYVGNRNDIHLSHGDVEYTVKFDASFAGAELRCYPTYAMSELLGVLDSNGSCTFKTPWHWTVRKEQDLGLRLHDVGNPEPFFNIWSIYVYGTEPSIYSDTLGSMKDVTGRLSSGFGNELTITGIPDTILEIEISNDRWGHAGNAATPFATAKRVTRASGSAPFKVTPDKPTMLYSSKAGTMLYYLNYIQVMFVKDGEVTNQGQWFEYKLNVIA